MRHRQRALSRHRARSNSRLRRSSRTLHIRHRRILRPTRNSNTSRQLTDHRPRLFLNQRRLRRTHIRKIINITRRQGRTVLNRPTISISALLHSLRLHIHVPSVQEISVEAIPRGITLGEDEFAAVKVHVVDGVEDFVEEMDELNGVAGGTDAVVHHGHVRYVAVILFVEVYPVPAGLEMDLCS